jgi:hypothetical protein
VENVLAIDAIGAIGRFLIALGQSLADMVEEGVLQRRMELGHYSLVLSVSEVHYEGYVVIGTPSAGIRVAVGDEVIVFGKSVCRPVTLQSVQLHGHAVQDTTGNGQTEVGLRLSKRAPHGAELRRLRIHAEAPKEMQLKLEDAMPAIADAADTDLVEVAEPESVEAEGEANDQEVAHD